MSGNTPLRLYSDLDAVRPGWQPAAILSPFQKSQVDCPAAFKTLAERGRDFLEMTDASRAHLAVLPFDGHVILRGPRETRRLAADMAMTFVEDAARKGLKTLVVIHCDSEEPCPLPVSDTVVLRTSLNTLTRNKNEFALPANHESLIDNYCGGVLPVRPWHEQPAVGFCGLAARTEPGWKRHLKNAGTKIAQLAGKYIPPSDGVFLRRQAMHGLEKHPDVRTNFILRDACYHGDKKVDQREEFIHNILDNDYTLCARGYGNFSFRFYETLSLGRFPLFIDTACLLPFEPFQDYRDHFPVVPEAELSRIGDILRDFHARLDSAAGEEDQRNLRRLWSEKLSCYGFFKTFAKHWEEFANAS